MARQLFGTDGVRGRANTPPMTAEIAMRLGAAAGRYFRRDGSAAHRVGVEDHQVGALAREVGDDLLGRLHLGDVALQLHHALERRHGLQVHGHDLGPR